MFAREALGLVLEGVLTSLSVVRGEKGKWIDWEEKHNLAVSG
jgi:hypothetical protein